MATGRQGPGRGGARQALRRKRRTRMVKKMVQQQPQGAWGGPMREARLKALRRRLDVGRRMLAEMQERLEGLEEAISAADGSESPAKKRGRAAIRSSGARTDEYEEDDEEDDDEHEEGYGYGRQPYAARGRFTSLRDLQHQKVEVRRAARARDAGDDDEEEGDEEEEGRRGPLSALRGLRRKGARKATPPREDEDEDEEGDDDDGGHPSAEVLAEVFDELQGNRAEFAEGYPREASVSERLRAAGYRALSAARLRDEYDRYRMEAAEGSLDPRSRTLFRVFRSLEGRNTAFTRSGTPKVDDVNIILDFLGEPDSTREEIDEVFEKYRAP